MMTPDLAMIAEVMLAAEGFREARILAKKTVTLYSLMIQQLSKQVWSDRCQSYLLMSMVWENTATARTMSFFLSY